MIFNTEILKESMNKTNLSINDDKSVDMRSVSIFVETINYITSKSKSYLIDTNIENNMLPNTSIKDYINNNFFSSIIENIFNEFIDTINNTNEMYKSFIVSIEGENHIINNNKDILKDYSSNIVYPYDYITFVNLINDQSDMFSLSINTLYTELHDILTDILKNGTYESIYTAILSYKESLYSVDEFLSNVRAKIFGRFEEVSKEEFVNLLYNYFRDNTYSDNITLSCNKVKASYNSYMIDYKTLDKSINYCINNINRITKEYINKISNMNISTYIETPITEDLINQFNCILSNYINKINGICYMYVQYNSARLDAIKDCRIQDINILIAAIRKYKETGGRG